MAVTILEALQNAEINFTPVKGLSLQTQIGFSQLHNALTLLEKGYSPHDHLELLLEVHGEVENVPEKDLTQP